MAIQGVETKCYILALFVRDDDERFLLGSGHYEFKDSQKQFSANTIQNDVVEVQGNDGFLLAGQVRRPGTQSFDGYIGDGTTEKTEVEEYRRKFFSFFRKNHFYRVIYVFPDGSAIQRKRGFLVDDPTVEELYQQYPEYHVALNFEDVNYYTYSENEQGEEIYAEEAQIDLSSMVATGGLVWDEYGAVNQGYAWGGETTVSGTEFTVQNDLSLPAPVTDTRHNGDTYQQTYSGKNLAPSWNSGYTISRNGGDGSTYSVDGNSVTVNTQRRGWGIYLARTQAANINLCPYLFQDGYVVSVTLSATTSGQLRMGSEGVTINVDVGTEPVRVSFQTYADRNIIFYQQSEGTLEYTIRDIQCELGSTATNYEPYVGGTASPNPDYPQDIHVVTGEQTVSVTGKNLFNKNGTLTNGYLRNNGTISGTAWRITDYIAIRPSTEYTTSGMTSGVGVNPARCYYDKDKNFISGVAHGSTVDTYFTNTSPANAYYMRDSLQTADLDTIQIEEGSATAYQLYQSQTYTVDLGTTELCKIGDYQDYLSKSGDDWYLHKEIGKQTIDGTSTWTVQNNTKTNYVYYQTTSPTFIPTGVNDVAPALSTQLIAMSGSVANNSDTSAGFAFNTSGYLRANLPRVDFPNAAAVKSHFTANPMDVYYALETPTDTKITDTTLSSQLDALGSAKLMVGENNVLVSATDTNLPAELQIKYYSTVSFDGAGFVWDEGGSGGPTTVQIDSITNVYPIWKVKGPAVNPELSVITTNTTLKYEGSVGANQTLVIDMMNKTAKINGTSVIGNVTGDWVNFTPGINRVVYITDNADTPPSLIEWQEVVG